VCQSELKFLLDENVDKRLEKFLKQEGFDVKAAPKTISNGKLAPFSKSEKRILVTNDADFTDSWLFPKDKVFSVIWLRTPQEDVSVLLKSFSKLLKSKEKLSDFEGCLITLKEDDFDVAPISSVKSFTK